MQFIKGVTFAPFSHKGSLQTKEALESLDNLKKNTGANFITLVPNGLQETPQSEEISYMNDANVSDEELIAMIQYAHKIDLQVALKPTVNCKNGAWRAYINFFDKDVHCEPKWSNWFASYTAFQLHYAKIAEETGCEMFLAGCEMVMSQRREKEWRKLISDIKSVYSGPVSYNTDKYQEDTITWWDCVDVISSSGYYPTNDWEQELDRIEAVVNKFNKPFFFAECGCMSTQGSSKAPNDWRVHGDVDLKEQADWYTAMFEACKKRSWVGGFCLWDWAWKQYPASKAASNGGYDIYEKPAQAVVKKYYDMF
ncbi:MAG: glycoside hydrolase family 113 [Suilimivivens sp.]